jgi:hypothetical protein
MNLCGQISRHGWGLMNGDGVAERGGRMTGAFFVPLWGVFVPLGGILFISRIKGLDLP